MLLEKERELVVEYGKKLITAGLTRGTGGNISVINKKESLMAISPSGMDYFETEPEDVVIMDLEGEIVDGFRKPSSEWRMHLIFYQKRGRWRRSSYAFNVRYYNCHLALGNTTCSLFDRLCRKESSLCALCHLWYAGNS